MHVLISCDKHDRLWAQRVVELLGTGMGLPFKTRTIWPFIYC